MINTIIAYQLTNTLAADLHIQMVHFVIVLGNLFALDIMRCEGETGAAGAGDNAFIGLLSSVDTLLS